jgi:hypothetical protein
VQKFYDVLNRSFICDLFWNDYGAAYGLKKRDDVGTTTQPKYIPTKDIPAPEIIPESPPPPPSSSPPPSSAPPAPPPPLSPPTPKPKEPENIGNEIVVLLERYTFDQQAEIQQVLELLKLTRKGGKISDSILLAELRRWNTLDVHRVMYGVRRYIDRGYHNENKREEYLWAVMKRVSETELSREPFRQPANGSSQSIPPITQRNIAALQEYRRLQSDTEQMDT